MKPQKKHCKDINTLRRTQGKRTLADYETCKIELQNEIEPFAIVKLESEQPKEIATPKLKQKQIEKQA